MQSSLVLQPEDLQEVLVLGHVWTDMGPWALIQKLISSSFLLKGSKKESPKCDGTLIILSGAFMYFLHEVGGGRVEERLEKKHESRFSPYTVLHFRRFLSEPCPSSENSDGTGHALFIDNNCCRTSKRAHN